MPKIGFRKIWLIAGRDYLASIQTKAFLIGLIVFPVLFGGAFAGAAFMRARPDLRERRIAILDRTGIAAAPIMEAAREENQRDLYDKITGRQTMPRYQFEAVAADERRLNEQELALSDRVRSGDLLAFIVVGPEALHAQANEPGAVEYYSNAAGAGAGGGANSLERWFGDAVNEGLRRARLAQLGVDSSHFADVLASVPLQSMELVAKDAKNGGIAKPRKKSQLAGAIPIVLVFLLGMIVLIASAPMLSGVTEDKLQRVYEMLLGAATPFELIMGKVLASVGRSLTSSIFYIIGALLVLQGLALIGLAPLELLPWFFVYLAAEVVMLSSLAAAFGSACGSTQDAQSFAFILMLPVMIPFFVMAPVLQQPNGVLGTVMSLIPPFTPMLMLLRQAAPGGVPGWQPWAGLAGVVACTVAVTWATGRIFRVAILAQGSQPKIAQLVRWAVRG